MKDKRILLIILIIIIFFILSVIFSIINFGNTDIISGISIGKINISGNSKENTINLLNNFIN